MAGAWLVAALLALGPNGSAVAGLQVGTPPVEVVPRAFVHEAMAPLYVVTFEGGAEPLARQGALYLPAGQPERVVALAALGGDVERLMPGIDAPRLALRRALFVVPARSADGPARSAVPIDAVSIDAMATDVAERFFDALLDARLEHMLADAELRDVVQRRADDLLAEAPPEQRLEAYRGALVAFGANLLSIATQVERLHARRGDRLCALIESEALLFAHWRRTVESAPFRALLGAGIGVEGRWSDATLAREDKQWLIREVLGATWTGVPRDDFAALCR
ncbi:MAG: hypothetical protein AAGC60_25600 [Acidobacteriota bacterium]